MHRVSCRSSCAQDRVVTGGQSPSTPRAPGRRLPKRSRFRDAAPVNPDGMNGLHSHTSILTHGLTSRSRMVSFEPYRREPCSNFRARCQSHALAASSDSSSGRNIDHSSLTVNLFRSVAGAQFGPPVMGPIKRRSPFVDAWLCATRGRLLARSTQNSPFTPRLWASGSVGGMLSTTMVLRMGC